MNRSKVPCNSAENRGPTLSTPVLGFPVIVTLYEWSADPR
jgi:hypothetical protein